MASPPVIRWPRMVGTSSWNSIRLAPKRTPGWLRWARSTAGWASTNSNPGSNAPVIAPTCCIIHSRPGPQASASMSLPVHLILNVPGPSGLNDARQNSPLVSWVVGSPAPKRYADKQAAGPAFACVTAPPLIRSTVASGCDAVVNGPYDHAARGVECSAPGRVPRGTPQPGCGVLGARAGATWHSTNSVASPAVGHNGEGWGFRTNLAIVVAAG